jgi:molybdenum cofactor cytidylyltransferase
MLTSAVILAAGESKRMGRPKPLLDWGGVPLVRHVAQVFADGGAAEVVVVTGCSAEAVACAAGPPTLAGGVPLRIAENTDWRLGMSSSAAAGARACSRDAESIVVCPADLPMLRPANVAALIRGFLELRRAHPGCGAAVAAHEGRRGHPAIIAAELRAALERLGAAGTLRDLLDLGMCGAPSGLALIEAGPECIAPDIDVPDDYTSARSQMDWSEPT